MYNFNQQNPLMMISDSGMISHYCWVENDGLIAYMSHNGINGYYLINLKDNPNIENIEIPGLRSFGDGHPTYIGDGKFITDTYPNKRRVKHLLLVDLKLKNVKTLAELYEPLVFDGETRCDLHPKWDRVHKMVYVDSVHEGIRALYKVGPINNA